LVQGERVKEGIVMFLASVITPLAVKV